MQTLINTYIRLIKNTKCDNIRYIHSKIAWTERLIGLKGARGVGKTTLLLQHIKLTFNDLTQAFYVSLDNLWFSTHTLSELVDYLYTHGVNHLFLDEVHRYKGWIREIKNIYDSYPDLRIVFTGSSIIELSGAEADLSRRVRMYHMHGLSLREYIQFTKDIKIEPFSLDDILTRHIQISAHITDMVKILPLFENYISMGYYPFFLEVSDKESYYERINRIVSVAIDEDILAIEDLNYETLQKTKRLLITLAQTVPFSPNISTLCETLSSTRNQVLKLMQLLDRADMLRMLHSDNKNLKAIGKPDKLLFNNPNLMTALVSTPDKGTIRESFFASMTTENHTLSYPPSGDLLIDHQQLFEIGGKNKSFSQIRNIENSYIAADNIENGFGNKIPLYLFGFLY